MNWRMNILTPKRIASVPEEVGKEFPLSTPPTYTASFHDVLNLPSILSPKWLTSPAHPTLSLCISIYHVFQSSTRGEMELW